MAKVHNDYPGDPRAIFVDVLGAETLNLVLNFHSK